MRNKCKKLRSKGYLMAEIANKLKISKSEVRNYIIDYKHPYTTKDELDEMVRLRSNGLTYNEIGKLFNKSKTTIYRQLNRKCKKYDSLEDYNRILTESELRKFYKLYCENKSISDIADIMNMTIDQCKYRINIIKEYK